ncbi:MAG TPA: heparin lyase I family protein [Caulobacteraceae bacterium]
MRRRDFAAAALLAFAPGSALARLKVTHGARLGAKKTTTDTTTPTTTEPTTTTTTEPTTTTTSPTTTPTTEATVESYCAPSVNSLGRTTFADWEWTLQRDKTKLYPIQEVVGMDPVRHRFETRSTDSWNSETTRNRAELALTHRFAPAGQSIWFSYAMRVRGGAPVTNWNVLSQFHNSPDSGDISTSPPFSMNMVPGEKLRFIRRFDAAPLSTTKRDDITMGERVISRDRWYRIVGRLVFGWDNNASVDVWIDGAKMISLANTNMGYNDMRGPYFKFGIYRAKVAETLVADFANMELGTTSLLTRVTSPLDI